jgi:hypothetical protein
VATTGAAGRARGSASAVWEQRGVAVGLVACVVYGALFLPSVVNPGRQVRITSRRQALLDQLWVFPICFCALAALTSWPLLTCALIAVATGTILLALTAWRWRGDPAR